MKNLFLTLILILLVPQVWAGMAKNINAEGDPIAWNKTAASPITADVEAGACGRFSNAEAITRLEDAIGLWGDESYIDIGFTVSTSEITVDVDGDNYTSYLSGVVGNTTIQNIQNISDGLNPVVFDQDGEVVDSATGVSNGRLFILGFASPVAYGATSGVFTSIEEAQIVMNCYCMTNALGDALNSDCSTAFTDTMNSWATTHEMGHFLGLDHSSINNDLTSDDIDDNETELPTMYPSFVDNTQATLHEDDITAMASLYPSSTFFAESDSGTDYCKVTGTLKDRYGEDMRCAAVQMVVDSNADLNVEFVSGTYAVDADANDDDDTVDDGECTSGCGDFVFYLQPGQTYSMQILKIPSSFINGSGLGPCRASQLPLCSATNLANCDDGDSSTTCSACVVNETLSTNSAAANISDTITASCAAGEVVALGNVATSSVGLDSDDSTEAGSTTSSGSSTGSSTGSSSTSSSGCSLQYGSSLPFSNGLMFIFGVLFLSFFVVREARQ